MDRKTVARGLKRTGIAVGALVAILLVWGSLVEPRVIDAEEHTAWVPRLPAGWEGARVAVVADYQVGMWGANLGTMRRTSRHLVEARPAAVLIAGDFVYKTGEDPSEEIARVVEIVRPLAAAGIPTFAVLGNHDFGLNQKEDAKEEAVAAAVRAALEAAGIRVLHNEAVVLPAPSGGARADGESGRLYLVGIGSEWADEARPDEALGEVPEGAARIVFMHNPDTFRRIPAGEAPMAVAAHTHGGQVRIPGTPDWSWLQLVVKGPATADGWIEDGYGLPGNRLYVNRGIGFSTIPLRINAAPEITYFQLRAAAATVP